LKRKQTVVEQKVNTYAGVDWEAKVNDYLADLQSGIEELNSSAPQTPKEQYRILLLKKQLEAIIDGKRDIQVKFRTKIIDLAVSKKYWIFRMMEKL